MAEWVMERLTARHDRHAQKELQKRVRGLRSLERQVEARADAAAKAIQGCGSAVRSAWTADGRPPREASGLKLHARLAAISASLEQVEEKRGGRATANG